MNKINKGIKNKNENERSKATNDSINNSVGNYNHHDFLKEIREREQQLAAMRITIAYAIFGVLWLGFFFYSAYTVLTQ